MLRFALPILLLLLPRVGEACAVCASNAEDANRLAFIASTAFMTIFPLVVLGLSILWFVRKLHEHERQQEEIQGRVQTQATRP